MKGGARRSERRGKKEWKKGQEGVKGGTRRSERRGKKE